MQAPCKDCPGRSVTCHAEREKYREFATANAEQRKQRHIENVGRQYTIEKYNKTVKKRSKMSEAKLFNDNFQNFRRYGIPKAQLVIADIPYNIGNNFYGSNPMWYVGGDNKNGESKLAGKAAFNSDYNFNIVEYFHFCNRLLKKEPKEKQQRGRSSNAPCMIVFCAYEQQQKVIETAKRYGFPHFIPIVFIKNYSPQVLKANMRIVGACEYALVLYRDKLPKFRNDGRMIFNWFTWEKDNAKYIPKIHPAQKPVATLKKLIEIFTDEGDVVIDPCAGSGTTLRACQELGRRAFGFEISRDFYKRAVNEMLLDEENQVNSGNAQQLVLPI